MSTSEVAAIVSKRSGDFLSQQQTLSHEPQLESPFFYGISSIIKGPRCAKMIFLVLKRCQFLAKNCRRDGCLRAVSLGNSGMDLCTQEVYWGVFLVDIPEGKRGRQGWVEGEADPQMQQLRPQPILRKLWTWGGSKLRQGGRS